MAGGLQVSESPLAPLKGGGQQVLWPVPAGHLAESPTARRLCKGYRLSVMGYRMGLFGTAVEVGAAAALERPNKKCKVCLMGTFLYFGVF